MTRELVVISGKGGTGKTSIVAGLATLARPIVLADCDVDAPDLPILTDPQVRQTHRFQGGRKACIVVDQCCGCGRCVEVCRFNAIGEGPASDVVGMTYAVDPTICEGCGACVSVCPAEAIRFELEDNGRWFVSETRFGPMIHARLDPGEENSGKLVSIVRREARAAAAATGLNLVLVDGAPGISCPVIASLTHAGLALVVAEPTPSGAHDALRVIDLARQMHIRTALCVNRWDISPGWTERLEREAAARGVTIVGRVRDDAEMVAAQMRNRSLIEGADSPAARDVRRLWQALKAWTASRPLETSRS